jgi:hypothetical protein
MAGGITMDAIDLIYAERQRQLNTKGWTREHDDDNHCSGELALAAVCYATPEKKRNYNYDGKAPREWPWHDSAWNPSPDDRICELIKAGALILAEIERLQRSKGGA